MANTLQAGSGLTAGQSLTSDNGAYTLTLQDDGNLVLGENGNAVWASKTEGKSVTKADLQDDGNFVLYTDGNDAVWASQTSGNSGVRLVLQDDRNVVLYAGDNAVWSTDTVTDTPAAAPEPEPAPVEPAAAEAPPAPAAQTHTVESGDTLWDLAQRFYGDGNQFQRIADANGIPNPDAINVGQVLTIPA
ncbi:LysM peptidoglycan-binding domain-containing protein [Rhodococcus sp. NPDC059234]|uniref:LysM peptidoglycan-binding domain-containing protein n=1 Tax=Rhodococcus sp. NPDC059234 TaxID=3346781 RepID=UPI00366E18F4